MSLKVGGSSAGLMHGIMLKRMGHDVQVLEQQSASNRAGQAAGISASSFTQQFLEKFDLVDTEYCVPLSGLQYTDTDFNFRKVAPIEYKMTNWQTLYHSLRANFDGLSSPFVPSAPKSRISDGQSRYLAGRKVTSLSFDGDRVLLDVEDVENGDKDQMQADLVVAADGAHSTIRQQLCPTVSDPYSGYIAYRGTIPETAISEETLSIFRIKAFLYPLKNKSYIIIYIIPGDNGETEAGKRNINFVWYSNLAANSQDFQNTMTDTDGVIHRNTLPIGKMRQEVWLNLREQSEDLMSPPVQEILQHMSSPFVTTITDYECPRATFFDHKLFLVGDAFSLFRSHVAQSTNQAAMHCLLLEKVLTGEMSAMEWEKRAKSYAHLTRLWTNSLGSQYLLPYIMSLYHQFRFRLATTAERWGYII